MTTTITSLTQQGVFDSTLESAINTNFTNLQTTADAATTVAAGAPQLATATLQAFVGPIAASGLKLAPVAITASGAIAAHTAASYVITKSSAAAAMTLAAPTATTDDGVIIAVYANSSTPRAHTITATGLFLDGTTTTDVATFAAQNGAGVILMAHQAKWIVLVQSVGITMS